LEDYKGPAAHHQGNTLMCGIEFEEIMAKFPQISWKTWIETNELHIWWTQWDPHQDTL
jgi:hypothetical protein